jgi:hypothetical protein
MRTCSAPRSRSCTAAALAIALLIAVPAVHAAPYPVNACVSSKQNAAGSYCKAALDAWANFELNQNAGARDAALAKAAAKLSSAWTLAQGRSATKGSDCAETTLGAADTTNMIDGAVVNLVNQLNDTLDPSQRSQASCGKNLLRAAATACGKLLNAEGKYIKVLANDPQATARDAAQAQARTAFASAFSDAIKNGCPVADSQSAVASALDALSQSVVLSTIVSPNVDATQFTTYTPVGPIAYQGKQLDPVCMNGSPYAFFAKRGTVNKLLIYYQGGGACWENVTCNLPTCDTNVNPSGGDNPNNQHTGFADQTNPLNPFQDWNVVFVSYCSCDIHYGDADQHYTGLLPPIDVKHHGFDNARVVEKWAREHFLNPEQIFVTGSSAGAYGAWFNAPLHEFVWPSSHFDVLADAGNGVITQDFLDNEFPHWNFAANLPDNIPGLQETLTNGTGIPGYTKVVADAFPETRWAQYASAYDGSTGGQTGFYQVMQHPGDVAEWPNWWESSCAWNAKMEQQVQQSAAANPDNYRYFVGTGSRHTMWGSNKVYTDTTGGVPLLVDWINAMLDGSPAWTNVQCAPDACGVLLPGDPRPNPLVAPFVQQGSDVVVDCQ